jgi:hypothetical protein
VTTTWTQEEVEKELTETDFAGRRRAVNHTDEECKLKWSAIAPIWLFWTGIIPTVGSARRLVNILSFDVSFGSKFFHFVWQSFFGSISAFHSTSVTLGCRELGLAVLGRR